MSLLILSITAKHNYCSMSRNPGLHFIFQENNDCLFPTLKNMYLDWLIKIMQPLLFRSLFLRLIAVKKKNKQCESLSTFITYWSFAYLYFRQKSLMLKNKVIFLEPVQFFLTLKYVCIVLVTEGSAL